MNLNNPCKLCSQCEAKYVCPRCNIPYCSLPCYQSEAHTQCSEGFYKDCVVQQLKDEDLDPQSQQKMLDILQRVQHIDQQFGEEECEADSDDENSLEELAVRLGGVDLDDADEVWTRLTEDERREFEHLLQGGDASQVVPQWQPWWLYREKKKLVEDIGAISSSAQSSEEAEQTQTCPPLKDDIPVLSKLTKVRPAGAVRWGVVNVLAAYSVVTRVYNGDHHASALEAAAVLTSLSHSLSRGQAYQSPELAVVAVHMAAVSGDHLVEGVEPQALNEDVQRLVEGPSSSRHNHYVLAALSDVHTLFTTAKHNLKGKSSVGKKGEFSKRFPNATDSSSISASELNKCLKKIEFYLSWTKECY